MPAADTRQEFAPPHTPGMLRALVLALVAHAALVAVLAIGVAWKRELPPATVEAELWSAIPQEAAPPAPEEPPPEPETTPTPEVKPPPPAPPVEKQAPPDTPSQADIALAKEKERRLEAQKAKALELKQAQEKERQLKEKRLQEQAAKDKLDKEKAAKEKAAREAKEKTDKVKAADAAKQKAERTAKEDAKRSDELRQQQLNRLTGLAGAAGNGSNPNSTAAKSSGPGASYGGRIQAAVKPNITFTDTIVGNPKTEIEVSLSGSGEILSKRIVKRSGNKAWDDAAENAIDKTRKLPLDDGKVWSPMIIVISPQTLVGP